jgi:hypothetical protein
VFDRVGSGFVNIGQISSAPPTTTGIAILTLIAGLVGLAIKGAFEIKKLREAAKVAATSAKIVEHEVTPNSGQSLRDQIDRLNKTVDKLDDKMDKQVERLVRVETIVNGNGQNYGRRTTDR